MNQGEIHEMQPMRTWPGRRRTLLRFVLLRHLPETSAPHFDLLLELHPRRKLWDLVSSTDPTLAQITIEWSAHGLHRRRYLRFEGEIGQHRGIVKRVESGQYVVYGNGGALRIQLIGAHWKRTFQMLRERFGRYRWVHVRREAPDFGDTICNLVRGRTGIRKSE